MSAGRARSGNSASNGRCVTTEDFQSYLLRTLQVSDVSCTLSAEAGVVHLT